MNYLKAYQQQLGLVADGQIGPLTFAAMMKDLQRTNAVEMVLMLGQMQLESGNFAFFRENLNYSEDKLVEKFSKYYVNFPTLIRSHARQPRLIANHVYANRNGNGNFASGDGWFYRGGLGIQITFKNNWQRFFEYLGKPLKTNPDDLKDDYRAYFQSACFYFDMNKLEKHCTGTDRQCILNIGRAVNVGKINTTVFPNDFQLREKHTLAIAKAVGLA